MARFPGIQIFRGPDPFPPRRVATLRYSSTSYLSSDSTYPQAYGLEGPTYRLNSLYSPQSTGSGGHQPYGFDQLAALYRRYKVTDVRINVSVSNSSGANSRYTLLFLPPAGAFNMSGVLADRVGELPNCIHLDLATATTKSFNKSWHLSELMQVSREQFDNDIEDYQALVTASPVLYPTMQQAVCSQGTDAGGTTARVVLEYRAVFWERPIQNQS